MLQSATAADLQPSAVTKLINDAHQNQGFSGAVLIAKDGRVLVDCYVGTLSPESARKIDSSTLFEIASCTKPFTAIALLKLAEEGKLGLDDPISQHLKEVPDNCQGITIRHLLQHTSGIPGTNTRGAGDDISVVVPSFLNGGPQSKPGTRHEYWNQGYSLLSEIIAVASGQSYTDYCRSQIFEPCEMHSTRFTGDAAVPGDHIATGHSTKGASRTALEHPYGSYGFQYRGMGGAVTSTDNLLKWHQCLTDGKLLRPESIAEMTDPHAFTYGLGWQIGKSPSGSAVWFHSGSVRGFLANLYYDPAEKFFLSIFANSDDATSFNTVTVGCKQLVYGKQTTSGRPTPVAAKLSRKLSGTYQDAKGRKFSISRKGENLLLVIDWGGRRQMAMLG